MKIAVFDAAAFYLHAPSLRCMIEEFERSGCDVDVYTSTIKESLSPSRRIRYKPFPVAFKLWVDIKDTLSSWKYSWKYKIKNKTSIWETFWKANPIAGHISLYRTNYDLAIGVDSVGVVYANRLYLKKGTPFVYLSFEMIFMDELQNGVQRQLKRNELIACKNSSMIICPDPWRAEMLQRENNIPFSKFVFLPVAPRAGGLPKRTNYLREKFNLPMSSTIVINSGSFIHFTNADAIIDSLKHWPSNFVFIVNGPKRFPDNITKEYYKRLQLLALPNVYLMEGGLTADEYENMLASADIGLALYKPLSSRHPRYGKNISTYGRNIEIMGLSSGKLASYLQAGVPAVVSGNPILQSFISEYPFGIYIKDASEIPNALLKIQANRQSYANAARNFFLDYLDFERFWPQVWHKMQSLCNQRFN